jgi:hypothetical protein
MKSESATLFIGGKADGKRIVLTHKTYSFLTPISEVTPEGKFKSEIYTRHVITGQTKLFTVMAVKGMTGDELIERLISGYYEK